MPQRLLPFVADVSNAALSTTAVYLTSLWGSAHVLGVSVFTLFTLQSPEAPTVPASPEMQFIRWAIEQGGLVVAIAVMFYMYRRQERENSTRLVEITSAHAAKLAELVKDRDQDLKDERERNTAYAVLLRDNTVAITKLTTAIEDAQNERFPPRQQMRHP